MSTTDYLKSDLTGSTESWSFIDLDDKPRVLDATHLEQMAAPDEVGSDDDDRERFYAVARVNGVISYGAGPLQKATGASVLYVSASGQAFERQFKIAESDYSEIPRVTVAPTGAPVLKDSTSWMDETLDRVLDAHREVER